MWDVMIKKLFELVFQTWPPPTFNLDVIKFAVFFFEVFPKCTILQINGSLKQILDLPLQELFGN